jgi:DNA modification methylase
MTLPLNQIICGDNCDVLGTLPRECIDLVVTSPPYDDLRTYGGHSWDFYGVAWQLKRVLKPGGVIVWVVADATKDGSETGTSMEQALHFKRLGLRIHDTMIYSKSSFSNPFPNRYHQTWEYAFIFSSGAPSTFNPLTDRVNKYAGEIVASTVREADGSLSHRSPKEIAEFGKRFNVWTMDTAKNDGATLKHPAIFPEALARDHILSWSNEGDVVLDPFNGSGTTTKMARELGRKYIGIEVNPDYVAIAESRIDQKLLEFSA